MDTTLALSAEFSRASALLHGLVRQFENDIYQMNKSSSERLQSLRERAAVTWENWPAIKEDFKTAVNNLPKELRKRDFMHAAVKELEHFEDSAKAFLNRFSESSREAYTSFGPRWDVQLARIQAHSRAMAGQILELQDHPLIQKLTRGETILASRNKTQWGRKLGHMACGLFFFYLYGFSGLPQSIVMGVCTVFFVICFSLETARHLDPRVNEWVCRVFRPVMREREKTKINSGIFFMISMGVVFFVFPRDVLLLTMLFIALGDPVAGIVGVSFGRHKISKHTSLEGIIACFVLCAVLAFISVRFLFTGYHMTFIPLTAFSLIAGVIGAIAESSFKRLDDNLVMPLISAPALWLLLKFF